MNTCRRLHKEPALGSCAQRILALRPTLIELIVPVVSEHFQGLTPSQIMATIGLSKDFWRHTRAFQHILAEGRQDSNLRPSATTAVRVASGWRVSDRRGRTRPTIDAIGGRHQVLLPLAWAQDQADAIRK